MYCKNQLWEKSNEVSRVSPEFPSSRLTVDVKLPSLRDAAK
jgi:hypothetical protein